LYSLCNGSVHIQQQLWFSLIVGVGMFQEAIETYEEAVAKRPSHYAPQSLYNMLGE